MLDAYGRLLQSLSQPDNCRHLQEVPGAFIIKFSDILRIRNFEQVCFFGKNEPTHYSVLEPMLETLLTIARSIERALDNVARSHIALRSS